MAELQSCGLARHLATGSLFRDIKKNLGYNQTMLNTMSSCKDIGASVGIVSGLIAEITPTWFILLLGSLTNFVGYFMIWLAVTGRIAKPQFWQMCLYIFIAANSQNFANTGSLVTCVKNFPESRSIMLGLLKGLAACNYIVLFLYTIREKEVKVKQSNEVNVFYHFLYLSAALAVFLMAMTLTQQRVNFSATAYMASAIVACVFVFLPGVVAIRQEVLLWRQIREHPNDIIIEKLQPDELQQNPTKKGEEPKKSFFADVFNKPPRGEDYSILQAIFSVDMLIIFIATLVGLGSCLTAIDNLGQIGEALLYEPKTVKTFVSMISIWNYSGRVFSGFISEILLMKYKVPRPVLLSAVLFFLSIGLAMIAFPFSGSIYVASLIIGFTFGAQLPLVFAIISEIFGLKHYSTLFNCGQMASPIGSFLFNKELTGRLYDREAKKMPGLGGEKNKVCKGVQCFNLSFKVMALATLIAAFISVILVVRTKEFYKGDLYKRYRGDTFIRIEEEEKEKDTTAAAK
ncbi:protein nuclear fusion defective 4 [Quercus suber]|uniref:Protein nuclear fusion defective 4 n=1 Tax=Quercus suber TaxID=58331 RepID=A0AAW0LZH0_QUESU